MILQVAKKITRVLVENGADESQKEVYEYALICLLNEAFIDGLLLFGAYLIGAFWEMILWIAVFNSMRMNIGGFHAKTPERCSLYSVVLGVLSVWMGKISVFGRIQIVILFLICFGIVCKSAPILNPNHPLSEENKKKAKNRGVLFLVFWCLLSLGLREIWQGGVSAIVFAAIFSCGLVLIEYIKSNK